MFNALLILIPVLGAETIAGAFSQNSIGDSPTIESLDTTRRNMDAAFEAMVPRSADKREFWGDLVERELIEKDLSAARGYLLAAPVMLDRDSVKAVQAAAREERRGSEDERLARAALRFLSDDVSARYDEAVKPMGLQQSFEEEPAEDGEPANDTAPATDEQAADMAASVSASLGVLGDYTDLADNSKRWGAGDRVDPLVLKMTALALRAAGDDSARAISTIEAATIIKSARRARRLTPDFTELLTSRVNGALPDDPLKAALNASLAELATASVRAERVKAAYEDTLVPEGLDRLQMDLNQISRIGELTSKSGAVTLLEMVETGSELRKVRLLAEAGGDRAVALVKQSGDRALRHADAGIVWNNQMTLKVMGLAAAAMALLWAMLSTLMRAFPRRREAPEIFMGQGFEA